MVLISKISLRYFDDGTIKIDGEQDPMLLMLKLSDAIGYASRHFQEQLKDNLAKQPSSFAINGIENCQVNSLIKKGYK